jgi:hypothetical protein
MENYDTLEMAGQELVSLQDYAELKGVKAGKLRRYANNDKFPAAQKILGRWVVPVDAELPEMQEGRSQRFPGTTRYLVYVEDESVIEQLEAMDGVHIWDPREDGEDEGESESEPEAEAEANPFDDFG